MTTTMGRGGLVGVGRLAGVHRALREPATGPWQQGQQRGRTPNPRRPILLSRHDTRSGRGAAGGGGA